MRSFLIVFALVVFIISLNCSDNPSSNRDTRQIMPLEIGKTWRATVRMVYSPESADTLVDMTDIIDTVNVEGERWYQVLFFLDGDPVGEALMTNRSDGLWFWPTTADNISGEPYLWIKFPILRGQTYTKTGNPEEEITVIAIDTSITVPYGTFNCYCYRGLSFDDNIVVHRFYAPDTGLIKIHTVNSLVSPALEVFWELNSIDIN
jgi:hypothetical protein